MKILTTTLFLLFFAVINVLASIFFVNNQSVSVTEDGSLANPYKSIQNAANVAKYGDIIQIQKGIYREEVIIPENGLTFEPYSTDTVTINGTEILKAWIKVDNTSVYKTTMDWNCWPEEGGNQLFVDGKMIYLARWPKQTSNDIVKPTDALADAVSAGTGYNIIITDAQFNEPNGRWDNSQIWINLSHNGADGEGWTAKVLTTDSASHTITVDLGFSPRIGNQPWGVGDNTEYYLFNPTITGVNATGGIDSVLAEGEWLKNNTDVYVKLPNKAIPSNETGSNCVEARKRLFAFKPIVANANRNNITIRKFNLFACSITTDFDFNKRASETVEDANGYVIDSINALYVTHFTNHSGNWQDQWNTRSGIIVSGFNNTLKNSTIQYSAGPGVSVMGLGNKILNCKITQTNYGNTNAGALNTGNYCYDCELGYNIIDNTPMMAIAFKGFKNSDIKNRGIARVHHNKVTNFLRRGWDSGAIDEVGTDAQYVRIDHNEVYNTMNDAIDGGGRFAFYFDFGDESNPTEMSQARYIVDHNVVHNVYTPMQTNAARNLLIYNNLLLGTKNTYGTLSNGGANAGKSWGGGYQDTVVNNIMNGLPNFEVGDVKNYIGETGMYHTYFKNNIASNPKNTTRKPLDGNTIFANENDSINALFLNRDVFNFNLNNTATYAIDKGVTYPPYTDGFTGTSPDIGAYEYGKKPWQTGTPELFSPTINPNGGNFADSIQYTINTTQEGVDIRYTTNGSDPDINSPIFAGAITIHDSVCIKAKCFKNDTIISEPSIAKFNITKYNLSLHEPVTPQDITNGLNLEVYNYSGIKYTKIPNLNTLHPDTVLVVNEARIDRIPAEDKIDSFIYRYSGYIEIPTNGVYFFTTTSDDGSLLYISDTLVVNNDGVHGTTSKEGMIGLKAGKHNFLLEFLEVSGAQNLKVNYKGPGLFKQFIDPKQFWHNTYIEHTAQVRIEPRGRKFVASDTVILKCDTEGATIYYTLNGMQPTELSNQYTGPIVLTNTTQIKAVAIKQGMATGLTDSAWFIKSVAPVTISPKGGKFISEKTVTLTSITPDAEIFYTLNGTLPTRASLKYTGSLIIDKNCKLITAAFNNSLPESDTTVADFIIAVDNVKILPDVQSICKLQKITLTCTTPNSIIRYTTNNTVPTETSMLYEQPIEINTKTVIKSKAFKTGLLTSATMVKTYSIKTTGCPPPDDIYSNSNHTNSIIFPNPSVNGNFNIKLGSNFQNKTAKLQICNIYGQVLFNKVLNNYVNEEIHINNNLNKGLYIVNISNSNTTEQLKLIIK